MKPPKIMVVDDSEMACEVLRELLDAEGVDVVTHAGPFGTGAVILREKPDLVLLDIEMPGIHGDALLRLCRDRGVGEATRFLFWSGLPEAELARRTREARADGYICKGDMAEVVRRLLALVA